MTRRSVLLFARYADLLGAASVEVELRDGATTTDLIAALRALPGGVALPPQPVVALDRAKVELGTVIPPGVEIALLPPMAGG